MWIFVCFRPRFIPFQKHYIISEMHMWLISYHNISVLLYSLHSTKCVCLQKHSMHILVFRPDGPHLQKLHQMKCDINENVMVIFKLCRRNPIPGFPLVWIKHLMIFMELLAYGPLCCTWSFAHRKNAYRSKISLYPNTNYCTYFRDFILPQENRKTVKPKCLKTFRPTP